MNILHISPYVPSVKASHAGGVCMGKEIETLRNNHNVFVLSFVNDKNEQRIINKEYNEQDSKFIKSSFFSKIVNSILHLNKPNYFALRSSIMFTINIVKIIKKYEIQSIHAEYTSMGQYYWVKYLFPEIKFNLVEHDVTIQSYTRMYEDSKGLRKIYYLWQKKLVIKRERKYCEKADNVIVLNEKDKKILENYYNVEDPKILIPYYGVDYKMKENSNLYKNKNSICFIGQMGRTENNLAALRLIKIFIEMNRNDYMLTIIGANPSNEVLSYASDNIHITGFIDCIEDEIVKHEIAVFPLELGAGIKLKVLLAFGLGLPVVTTSIGAEGIDEVGEILLLAEEDYQIKEKIFNLLDNKKFLDDVKERSKEFVNEKFDWNKNLKLFNELYQMK